MLENMVVFFGNAGAAVISWLLTFCAILTPYYWMVDNVWNEGYEAPDWFFAMFLLAAFGVATLVATVVYRFYRGKMQDVQVANLFAKAEAKAKIKMARKL